MEYSKYNDSVFRSNVAGALKAVERMLELNRKPKVGGDVDHQYENKFELADQLTNTAIIAIVNTFRGMGLSERVWGSIDLSKPTTLRFQAHDSCALVKDQVVSVPSSYSIETDEEISTKSNAMFGKSKKSTITKVVKKVKEYHWKVEMGWELYLYSGTNTAKKITIAQRVASTILITQSSSGNDASPIAKYRNHPPIELSLVWLLRQINIAQSLAQFNIHRPSAKTPRRNDDVNEALEFCTELQKWSTGVLDHFRKKIESDILEQHDPAMPTTESDANFDLIDREVLFCPVLPLMEDKTEALTGGINVNPTSKNMLSFDPAFAINERGSPLLTKNDMTKLLNEQVRTLEEASKNLTNIFPAPQVPKLESTAEAAFVLFLTHMKQLVAGYRDGISYIESMLYHQLVAAIGKEVQSKDLDQFVKYHNAKLLHPPPQSLCRSIRRPDHYPDGLVSIERQGVQDEPIDTMVQPVESSDPIKISLNSATTVELTGDKYLHGWLQHRFGNDSQTNNNSFQISARARQFSSFILVIGTMIGPNQLQPKDAVIVQNKDELLIPLLLEELPTAKEFKDAIQSLSPEQQRFAKEFRSMQLESSVFGMCVIQIKPQLESLLCLPSDSLTKEMKLTQDLMELFIEYQVPSDLLSYDGDGDADMKSKVEEVRGHVSAVKGVIEESKEKQLEEEKRKADMRYEMQIMEKATPNSAVVESASIATARSKSSAISPSRAGRNMKVRMSAAPMMMMADSAPSTPSSKRAPSSSTSRRQTTFQDTQSHFITPSTSAGRGDGAAVDVTVIPKLLDSAIEVHDSDSAIRSTIIKTQPLWKRTRQENLLTKPEQSVLSAKDVRAEKNKAFDLLDALSRSGSLPIACSELHVVIAVTHCFEKDVIGTIIESNINPIEKLEKSTLLVASTIYGIPIHGLVRDVAILQRLERTFPALFDEGI